MTTSQEIENTVAKWIREEPKDSLPERFSRLMVPCIVRKETILQTYAELVEHCFRAANMSLKKDCQKLQDAPFALEEGQAEPDQAKVEKLLSRIHAHRQDDAKEYQERVKIHGEIVSAISKTKDEQRKTKLQEMRNDNQLYLVDWKLRLQVDEALYILAFQWRIAIRTVHPTSRFNALARIEFCVNHLRSILPQFHSPWIDFKPDNKMSKPEMRTPENPKVQQVFHKLSCHDFPKVQGNSLGACAVATITDGGHVFLCIWVPYLGCMDLAPQWIKEQYPKGASYSIYSITTAQNARFKHEKTCSKTEANLSETEVDRAMIQILASDPTAACQRDSWKAHVMRIAEHYAEWHEYSKKLEVSHKQYNNALVEYELGLIHEAKERIIAAAKSSTDLKGDRSQ